MTYGVHRVLRDDVLLERDGLIQAAEDPQQHCGVADDAGIARGQFKA
jgi:hypothetical protein